jgi:hypothetical protein
LANKTPSYDTKMLLKAAFDKTAFVKLKIGNDFKQNIAVTSVSDLDSLKSKA